MLVRIDIVHSNPLVAQSFFAFTMDGVGDVCSGAKEDSERSVQGYLRLDAAHKLRAQQEMVKAPSDLALDKLRQKKVEAVKALMDDPTEFGLKVRKNAKNAVKNLLVQVSQARKGPLKDFNDAERSLSNGLKDADKCIKEALTFYQQLDTAAAKSDEALQLVIARRELVDVLKNEKTMSQDTAEKLSTMRSRVLLQDRNDLDFVANAEILDGSVDAHRSSIDALKKAGKAVEWIGNKGALKKAQDLEQKEQLKEQSRCNARLKRLADKDAKAEARAQAKEDRAAAAAEAAAKKSKDADAQGDDVPDDGNGKSSKSKTSRLGRAMASELTDADPAVLRNRRQAIENLDPGAVVEAFAYGLPALVKTKSVIKKIAMQARSEKSRLQQIVDDAPLPEKLSLSSQIKATEERFERREKNEHEVVRQQFGNGRDVYEALRTALGDEATANLAQIVISGCRQNCVYTGLNSGPGLASVQYQHSGARLISFANFAELVDVFQTSSYSDVLERFRNVTSDEADQMVTPKQAAVRPGEMIVLPDGILYTEKALTAHSVALKVPSFFVTVRGFPGLQKLKDVFTEHIALVELCKACDHILSETRWIEDRADAASSHEHDTDWSAAATLDLAKQKQDHNGGGGNGDDLNQKDDGGGTSADNSKTETDNNYKMSAPASAPDAIQDGIGRAGAAENEKQDGDTGNNDNNGNMFAHASASVAIQVDCAVLVVSLSLAVLMWASIRHACCFLAKPPADATLLFLQQDGIVRADAANGPEASDSRKNTKDMIVSLIHEFNV
ncbi:unnamed protein product [Symbiodinium sp. CCMP2592]|nr:unnamed protein product [Symbiodinium sp. CCMP2592]